MTTITLIDSVPSYISPEEHKDIVASTPASFRDIPPVIRHVEQNVSVALDPPLDGFSQEDSANGTLHIIESVLVFMSSTGRGFQVEYPSITLHAISRAESGPSIYCQLDESPILGDDAEPEDNSISMRELSIIPRSEPALEPIFEALSICAALHPDAADDMDDDEDAFVDADGTNEFEVFDGNADQELSEVGRAALEHLESIISDPFEGNEQNEHTVNGVHGRTDDESDAS